MQTGRCRERHQQARNEQPDATPIGACAVSGAVGAGKARARARTRIDGGRVAQVGRGSDAEQDAAHGLARDVRALVGSWWTRAAAPA